MSAAVVATAMFALLIGWTGAIIYATFRQLNDEARRAAERHASQSWELPGGDA